MWLNILAVLEEFDSLVTKIANNYQMEGRTRGFKQV
jgi:hypothetical protein